jgi:hypothetical protein
MPYRKDTPIITGATYRHYKGGEYDVVTLATEEATGRSVVVYRCANKKTYVRPAVEWLERLNIEVEGRSEFVQRFEQVYA